MQKQPFKFEVGEEVINRLGHKCVLRDRKVNKYGANVYLLIEKGTLTVTAWVPEREFYPLTEKDKYVPKQYINEIDARCSTCGFDNGAYTRFFEINADTIEEAKVILSEYFGWQDIDGHWVCGECCDDFKEKIKEMVLDQQNRNPVINFRQRTFCMSCFTYENLNVDTIEEAHAILLNREYDNRWLKTKDGLVCYDCKINYID